MHILVSSPAVRFPGYPKPDQRVGAGIPESHFTTSCFSGVYPFFIRPVHSESGHQTAAEPPYTKTAGWHVALFVCRVLIRHQRPVPERLRFSRQSYANSSWARPTRCRTWTPLRQSTEQEAQSAQRMERMLSGSPRKCSRAIANCPYPSA